MQGKKLHIRFMLELELIHGQVDELHQFNDSAVCFQTDTPHKGPTHYAPELVEHLEYPCGALWWRSYYHFVHFHESLAVAPAKPS